MISLNYLYLVIFIAFLFDFVNGFHDAPNSIATIVATGALKPLWAVLWAAFFNFIAFLFFHLNVASTLGIGLVDPSVITPSVILAALLGAIIFNLMTWYKGIPSSSSHALIGGLLGGALAHASWHDLEAAGLIKVFIAILVSPVLGLVISVCLLWCLKKISPQVMQQTSSLKYFKYFQLVPAACLSLGHGGNDAQKTMGIIAVLLFSSGLIGKHFYVPFWVVITCNLVMGLGTLLGGFRIVKTLGQKITKLDPVNGSVAQASSAMVLFTANYYGIPVSTTHIVTGAITGAGTKHGWRSINWKILQKISIAWMITLPCSALIAAILFKLI